MKAYKVELLVIDHEEIGAKDIKILLEDSRYLNPHVKRIEVADIGEWDDDHPLNHPDTADAEYKRLFPIK